MAGDPDQRSPNKNSETSVSLHITHTHTTYILVQPLVYQNLANCIIYLEHVALYTYNVCIPCTVILYLLLVETSCEESLF